MNQGISQALSILLYSIAAVGLFSVVIALFGGGYYQYTADAGKSTAHNEFGLTTKGLTTAEKNSAKEISSVWDQFGATMKR